MNIISIVIPTLNEEYYLGGLLNDLMNQTVQPQEIIVVDGNSTDKTKEVARRFKNLTWIETTANIANQRNVGGKKVTSEIIIFLDADTRLKKDFIEKSLQEFEKRNLEIACPIYVPYEAPFYTVGFFYFLDTMFFLFQKFLPSGGGSCIIIKRNIFQRGKGFDTSMKFEDIEFIRREGKRNRFGILLQKVYTSDRRFKKYGFLRTSFLYLLLSVMFTFGLFKQANGIRYDYGKYKE